MYFIIMIVLGLVSPPYFIVVTCCFVTLYPALHLFFYKNTKYRRLVFDDKMWMISRRIKGVVMLCLLPFVTYGWDNEVIVWCGIFYAAPFAATLCMSRMKYVQKMKHLLVMTFAVVAPYVDFLEETPARCAVVYCCFSCLLFWVELYDNRHMHLSICVCSWLWQVYYMAVNDMSLKGVLWVSCLVILVNDDVVSLQRRVEQSEL